MIDESYWHYPQCRQIGSWAAAYPWDYHSVQVIGGLAENLDRRRLNGDYFGSYYDTFAGAL